MSSPINRRLTRNLLLPVGDLAFGQQMISRLNFLENAQWWYPEQITAFQNDQLAHLIKVSYEEVPFYRELMDSVHVKPGDIRKAADLQKLPIVTKVMLRQNYPDRTVRNTGQKTYEASTSGSTGKNFYVREDAFTAGWYRATFMLELEWAGWSIGDPHLQTGMTLDRSLDRKFKDRLLNCHYFSAYQLDDNHLKLILDEIEKYHIRFLFGYPGSLYHIARYAKSNGWNIPLKSAVTWGDMLYPHYRKEIEGTFKTKVFDTYGCGEGFHIASQCEFGNYHIFSTDIVAEFLNNDGRHVTPGEEGDIVITRLHPGPMPLIRYVNGDRGVPAGNEACPCGRGFPLMKSISGRNTDVIFTPSGNRLIVHFFTGVLEHFQIIDKFQVIQRTHNSIDLKIVPVRQISSEQIDSIIKSLQEKGCSDLVINIEIVDEIPLPPSGKHRFIINEMKLPTEK